MENTQGEEFSRPRALTPSRQPCVEGAEAEMEKVRCRREVEAFLRALDEHAQEARAAPRQDRQILATHSD